MTTPMQTDINSEVKAVAAALTQKLAAVYSGPPAVPPEFAVKTSSVEEVKQRMLELLNRGVSAVGDAAASAGGAVADAGGRAGGGIRAMLEQASPQTRAAIRNALIGSGVGAGVGLIGGGTAYDAARGAAALGIAGGAGTYAVNKAIGMAGAPKFVPPSVEKSLNEMRENGMPTTPTPGGDDQSFILGKILGNPATSTLTAGTGLMAGAAAYDALDNSPSLSARFRSPLYHMGVKDDMAPIVGAKRPIPVWDKLRNVLKDGPDGVKARQEILPALKDKAMHTLGMTPDSRRAKVLRTTRARLEAAREAANAKGAKSVVESIDAMLGMGDDRLREALRAADKHQQWTNASQYVDKARSASYIRGARKAEFAFSAIPGGKGPGIEQFSKMVTKRPMSLRPRSLGTAALALGGAALIDRVALPAASNAIFGPSVSAEDVRRMGNP